MMIFCNNYEFLLNGLFSFQGQQLYLILELKLIIKLTLISNLTLII